MNSFYKYLIFFILGIILCIIFKKYLVEGYKICGLSEDSEGCDEDDGGTGWRRGIRVTRELSGGTRSSRHQQANEPLISSTETICQKPDQPDYNWWSLEDDTPGWSYSGWGYSAEPVTTDKGIYYCISRCMDDSDCKAVSYRLLKTTQPHGNYCKRWSEEEVDGENLPEFFEDGGQCRFADDTDSNQWYFAIKEDFVKKKICEPGSILTKKDNRDPVGPRIEDSGRHDLRYEYGKTYYCQKCPDGQIPNSDQTACVNLPDNSTGICFKSFNNLEYGNDVDLCSRADYNNVSNPRTAIAFSRGTSTHHTGQINGFDGSECIGPAGSRHQPGMLISGTFLSDNEKVLIIDEKSCSQNGMHGGYRVKWAGGGRRNGREDIWIDKQDILDGSITDYEKPGAIDFYCDEGYMYRDSAYSGPSCNLISYHPSIQPCLSGQVNDEIGDLNIWSNTFNRTRPCRYCEDGKHPNSNKSGCVDCPGGRAGTGGICSLCPSGKHPNSNRTSCETCPTGTGAGENGTCIQCEIGPQYAPLNNEGLRQRCQSVPEGKYSPNGEDLLDLPNNSTASTNSPYFTCNNGYSANNANEDDPQCTQCRPGYYRTNGADPYNSEYTLSDCQLCPSQYYQDEVGQSECKNIPNNGIGTSDSNGGSLRRGFKDFECSEGYFKSTDQCTIQELDDDYNNDENNALNYDINGRRMDQEVKLTSLTSSDLNLLEINPNCENHEDGSSINPILCDSENITKRANYIISDTEGIPTKCGDGKKPNDNRDDCVPCGIGEYCPYGLPLTCNEVDPDSFNEQNPISDDNPFYICTGDKLHKIGNISSSVDNKTIYYDSDNTVNNVYFDVIGGPPRSRYGGSQYKRNKRISIISDLYDRLQIPLPDVDYPANNLLVCPAGFKCDRYNPLTQPVPCDEGEEYCPEGTDISSAQCPNGYLCDSHYSTDRSNISPGRNRHKSYGSREHSCYSGGFCPGTQELLTTYSDYLESSPLGNVDCTDYKNDGYEYITQSNESISPDYCIRCESPRPFRNHDGDECISGRCEPINEGGNTIQQRVSGLDENDQPICERCEVGEHLNQDGTQCLSCGQDEFTATDEEGNTICKSINCTLPHTTSYIVTGNTPFNEDNELFNPTVKCAENYLGYPTIKKCSEAGENVILDGCYPTELFANKTKCGDFGSNSFVNMEEKCNNINKILLKNKNCKNEDCINTTYCCSNDAGKNIDNIFNNIHKLKSNDGYNEWVGSLNTKINRLDADNSTDISKITLNDNIISQIRSLITSRSNFKDKWVGTGVGEQLDDDIIWDRLTNSLKQYIDTDAELSSISDDDLTIAIKKYLINLDKPITDTDTGSNIYQKSPLDIFLFSKSYPSNVINQEDSDKIYPITLNNLL